MVDQAGFVQLAADTVLAEPETLPADSEPAGTADAAGARTDLAGALPDPSADIGTHSAVQTLQGLAQVEELGYLEAKWVLAALTGAETVIQVGQSQVGLTYCARTERLTWIQTTENQRPGDQGQS